MFTLMASCAGAVEYVDPLPDIYWTRYWDTGGPYTTSAEACKAPYGGMSEFTVSQYSVESTQQTVKALAVLTPTIITYGVNQPGTLIYAYCVWDMLYYPSGPRIDSRLDKDYPIASIKKCPIPTFYPSIPYSFDWWTDRCSRVSLNKLTITLSGGTEVEPSRGSDIKTLPIIATVKDQSTGQPPTSPVTVTVSLKVEDPKSGGHDHGDSATRPRGGIAEVETCASDDKCWTSPQPTDVNGQVVFNFNAPEASGTYTISAKCNGCSNTATKPVDVKVDDLWPIPASVYYTLTEDGSSKVIGSTTEHSSNHYLASAASMRLWKLSADYYNYQVLKGVKKPTLLHLNDACLKWGGVFDLDADWDEPHKEHRRGTVIDVRANSNPGAIPASDFDFFKQMAKLLRIDPHFEGGSANQHFHLRLLNRPE